MKTSKVLGYFGATVYLVVSILSLVGIIAWLRVFPVLWSFTEGFQVVLMSPQLESLNIELPFHVLILLFSVIYIVRLGRFASFSVKIGLGVIVGWFRSSLLKETPE